MLYASDLELRLCFRILDRKGGAGVLGGNKDKGQEKRCDTFGIIHFLADCQVVYPQFFNARFSGERIKSAKVYSVQLT